MANGLCWTWGCGFWIDGLEDKAKYEVREREWPDSLKRRRWPKFWKREGLQRPWGLYRDGVIIGMYETEAEAEAEEAV